MPRRTWWRCCAPRQISFSTGWFWMIGHQWLLYTTSIFFLFLLFFVYLFVTLYILYRSYHALPHVRIYIQYVEDRPDSLWASQCIDTYSLSLSVKIYIIIYIIILNIISLVYNEYIYIYIYLRKFWQGGWQMYTWALNLPDNIEGKRPESGTCRNPAICTSKRRVVCNPTAALDLHCALRIRCWISCQLPTT